ncbi:MAG: hypothetical protein KJ006_06160 [Thermoleophilia bacterium]|nr:hypothetical protein [Thermoleophilia bacterium]GIK76517.1 MAG: hypothetical protein BroJett022_02070 [Actinomycetes bacterium]
MHRGTTGSMRAIGTEAGPRRGRRLSTLLLVALAALVALPASADATGRIYWSNFEADTIAWADLDGSGGGTVDTTGATVDGPMGLTLDPAHGRIYWANWANHAGTTISWADLDGSGGGDLAITGATIAGPHGLAIDPADGPYGTLYWPNHEPITGVGSISWARLDAGGTGGVGADLNTAGATLDEPRGVTIDPVADRIYWANFGDGLGKSISWAGLDGTGGGDLISDIGSDPLAVGPEGTAIDPATRKIYWSDFGGKKLIQLADLPGGTGIATLDTTGAGTHGVHGVTIDPEANRIYWANWYSDGIAWASLDGTGGGDLATPGMTLSKPDQPSILKRPTATAAPAVSGGSGPGASLSCSTGTWAGDVLEALAYRAPESLSYGWTRDGAGVAGATASSITATAAGSYRCEVTATNAAGSTTATSAPHQVVPPPPSSEFSFGKLKLNRDRGTAKLAVELPGPGEVTLAGEHLTAVGKHPVAAGEVSLKVKPRGKAKRSLRRRGRTTVRPNVTFIPTGGEARTRVKRVRLIEKRKGR